MTKCIIYLFMTLFLFSCGNENIEKELPDGIPQTPKTEAQQIAEYHNVALNLYLKSPREKSLKELTFFELHDEIALLTDVTQLLFVD